MKFISIALLALLLLNISFATCPTASRDIYLAAVTGETEGGIFLLHVQVKPGNGTIYTGVFPLTGYSTQQSEQDAVDYAFSGTGIDGSECDVLFSMEGDFGGSTVDGPSAGAAMALATRAALINKPIRNDVVVTGTINPDGTIGEVGGLVEKSLAAYGGGATYILVPAMELPDAVIISSATKNSGFQAIEASTFSEAAKIAYSSPSEQFHSNFSMESKPLPQGLPQITYDADLARFSMLATKIVDGLQAQANGIGGAGMGGNLSRYFSSETAKYRELISMGYPFSAANSAFLLSIDVQYIRQADGANLDSAFVQTAQCAGSLSAPQKTRENFEWAVGSDLRRIWAQSKLNETVESRASGGDDGYSLLRNLLLSQGWCSISGQLASEANSIGGTPANESALATLASQKLSEAEELLYETDSPDLDALWHLDNGYIAEENGDYGAAIYEATYASTMQGIAGSPSTDIKSGIARLSSGGRASLWGKIYYGQGMYIHAQAKEDASAYPSAYRILLYSENLDKASEEINAALDAGSASAKPDIAGPIVSAALLACMGALLCLAILRMAGMGKNGFKQ